MESAMKRSPRLTRKRRHYYCVFYDPRQQPTRKWVALHTTSRERAAGLLRGLETRYLSGRYDPWGSAATLEEPTLEGAAEAFLARGRYTGRRGGTRWSAKTTAAYRAVLRRLVDSVPAGLPASYLTREMVERALEGAPATQQLQLLVWRMLCEELVRAGVLADNPCADVVPPRRRRREPRWLTRSEYRRLMASIDDRWYATAVQFAVSTGLRISEQRALVWGDIDFEAGLITVRKGKGAKRRLVPITPMAEEALLYRVGGYVDREAPVFTTQYGTAYKKNWSLSNRLKGYLDRAALPAGRDGGIVWHSLRHTYASWLRIEGVPLDRIQYWLGHESIRTTEVYAHVTPDAIKHEAHKAFRTA